MRSVVGSLVRLPLTKKLGQDEAVQVKAIWLGYDSAMMFLVVEVVVVVRDQCWEQKNPPVRS